MESNANETLKFITRLPEIRRVSTLYNRPSSQTMSKVFEMFKNYISVQVTNCKTSIYHFHTNHLDENKTDLQSNQFILLQGTQKLI